MLPEYQRVVLGDEADLNFEDLPGFELGKVGRREVLLEDNDVRDRMDLQDH